MTAHMAERLGVAAAQNAFQQWDRSQEAMEIVCLHLCRLAVDLRIIGLTDTDHGLWAAAGDAYRSETEFLFGRSISW